jgi:hypothetical protein
LLWKHNTQTRSLTTPTVSPGNRDTRRRIRYLCWPPFTARDLLARFPDQPDGWDRLGMVYEARGENRKAAESYRKVIAFIRLAEQVASASKQPFLDVP